MNNLTKLYTDIKDFADRHNMVNEFFLVNTEDELNQRDFNFRSMAFMPIDANISRESNSPVYTLDFGVILIDRMIPNDELQSISIAEENLFVIGQLQDFLLQEGYEVDFNDVDIVSSLGEEYNISSAMTTFSVVLGRTAYTKGIDF
jgi:hypothetical protein